MKKVVIALMMLFSVQTVFAQHMQRQEFDQAAAGFFTALREMSAAERKNGFCEEYLRQLSAEQTNPHRFIRSDALAYTVAVRSGCGYEMDPSAVTALLDDSLKANPGNFIANFFKGILSYDQKEARKYFHTARENLDEEKLKILNLNNRADFEKMVKQYLITKEPKR